MLALKPDGKDKPRMSLHMPTSIAVEQPMTPKPLGWMLAVATTWPDHLVYWGPTRASCRGSWWKMTGNCGSSPVVMGDHDQWDGKSCTTASCNCYGNGTLNVPEPGPEVKLSAVQGWVDVVGCPASPIVSGGPHIARFSHCHSSSCSWMAVQPQPSREAASYHIMEVMAV